MRAYCTTSIRIKRTQTIRKPSNQCQLLTSQNNKLKDTIMTIKKASVRMFCLRCGGLSGIRCRRHAKQHLDLWWYHNVSWLDTVVDEAYLQYEDVLPVLTRHKPTWRLTRSIFTKFICFAHVGLGSLHGIPIDVLSDYQVHRALLSLDTITDILQGLKSRMEAMIQTGLDRIEAAEEQPEEDQ